MPNLSRRSFIRWVIAGMAGACPIPSRAERKDGAPSVPEGLLQSEDRRVCHQVRDGEPLAVPAPSERRDVVIVGGGPSGLAAADEARSSDFVLLEKEDHVGGNAYADSWEGLHYSTGAAWDSLADPDWPDLAKRWKFDWKPIQGSDSACFEGVWIRNFWNGREDNPALDQLPYDAATKAGFRRFLKDIEPLPFEEDVAKFDARPFSDYLKGYPPQLKAFWDAFGLSNWGAPSELTSAYQGLQAARDWYREQRYTWEGGIGMASRLVYEALPEAVRRRILMGATVYKVRRVGRKAWVSFFHEGRPRTVEARAVIMATPKFITKFLVEDLPPRQYEAMAAMRYAPFLIYNLCFDRVVYNQGYDNWVIGAKHFTDFIPADWATHADGGDLSRKQVITVYAPKAEEGRAELQDDVKVLAQARAAAEELVALFPGWADHLREVRIFRRGHPMPMSMPGYYTKLQPLARRDFPPIYFAHSDSKGSNSDWMYAAVNGIAAARKALKRI